MNLIVNSSQVNVTLNNGPGSGNKASKVIVVKNEIYHETGEPQQVHRTIDRTNDLYVERITTASGKVIENSEPLSSHWGHGTDRPRD